MERCHMVLVVLLLLAAICKVMRCCSISCSVHIWLAYDYLHLSQLKKVLESCLQRMQHVW
jgi:hypothetical protein